MLTGGLSKFTKGYGVLPLVLIYLTMLLRTGKNIEDKHIKLVGSKLGGEKSKLYNQNEFSILALNR